MNRIVSSEYIAPAVKRIEVEHRAIAQKRKPGQFVIVHIDEHGERVPLTLVDSDPEAGTITLIVQAAGKSTKQLCDMAVGESIEDVLGPLGHASEVEKFGTVVVIGGGVGTGVAYPNAVALKEAGNYVISITGARNKDYVILEDELKQVSDECYITTDDGSYGYHGFTTQKLQELIDSGKQIDYVLAIGPMAMMRAAVEVTRPHDIKTVVSLNTIMVDGTGMCGGCRVVVGGETKFACVDGPEFDGHLVDFDILIKRGRAYAHEEEESFCRLDLQVEKLVPTPAERRKIPRQEMPMQDAVERIRNFDEVNLGFLEEALQIEAQRCLQCKQPLCVAGCPVGVKIPQFIDKIIERDYVAASRIIKEDNVLAEVCSRVCPQSEQCEGHCILTRKGDAVSIGALARYVTTYEREMGMKEAPKLKPKTGKKVAVIGSGPSSLSCAGDLIREGHDVTVFEALHEFGGVLAYGIPEFRLPKAIVKEDVQGLIDLGVEFRKNVVVGATYTIDELMKEQGYDAVFIGVGAGLPRFMQVPGENLVGIYSSNEFLTRVNLMKAYQFPNYDTPVFDCTDKVVAVIGGGNTALDSVRVSKRLGARNSYIIYRRTEEEMPARLEEIHHAKEEGIIFEFLRNPVEFIGDEKGWIKGMKLEKMELGEPDDSGRRRPVPIEGSEYVMDVDMVVIAVGNGSNPIIQKTTPDLAFNKWGNIIVDDETMQTNKAGVYAGGDIVTGGATVILAMGAGRKAAKAIDAYLQTV
ncbi:MAG: NADPH-dependent glutamate synthase [Anaerolineaceae bacterium]|nr:NADPH-dependent glutamate synthase [Anaerolineaceae bacterium]